MAGPPGAGGAGEAGGDALYLRIVGVEQLSGPKVRERCKGVEGGGVAARNSMRADEEAGLVKDIGSFGTCILEDARVGSFSGRGMSLVRSSEVGGDDSWTRLGDAMVEGEEDVVDE